MTRPRIEFYPPEHRNDNKLPVNSATMHDALHAADIAHDWAKGKEKKADKGQWQRFLFWVFVLLIFAPLITMIEYALMRHFLSIFGITL